MYAPVQEWKGHIHVKEVCVASEKADSSIETEEFSKNATYSALETSFVVHF